MTDDYENEKQTPDLLGKIKEGGLPEILMGPAGKAISRLIGAAADIPAAWLEEIAQDVRDRANARSKVSDALAQAVSEQVVDDPEVMERAKNSMLNRAYRAQINKDSVAKEAVLSLDNEPPSSDSEGPTDDFMMRFERYAEEATGDDVQLMFGRLLAGEIRKPGTVSPATLHLVSMLDPETAALIERVLPFASDDEDGPAFTSCVEPKLTRAEFAALERSGFWTAGTQLQLKLGNEGYVFQKMRGDTGALIFGESGQQITIEAAIISRAGTDIVSVVNRPLDFEGLARRMFESGAKKVAASQRLGQSGQVRVLREFLPPNFGAE